MTKEPDVRAALASLREWWPELAYATAAGLFLLAPHGYVVTVFALMTGGIAWMLAIRHRQLPLHRKVDRMTDSVGELVRDIRDARQDEPQRPQLRLVPSGRQER